VVSRELSAASVDLGFVMQNIINNHRFLAKKKNVINNAVTWTLSPLT
jgi:hypothetical protein